MVTSCSFPFWMGTRFPRMTQWAKCLVISSPLLLPLKAVITPILLPIVLRMGKTLLTLPIKRMKWTQLFPRRMGRLKFLPAVVLTNVPLEVLILSVWPVVLIRVSVWARKLSWSWKKLSSCWKKKKVVVRAPRPLRRPPL